LELYRRKNKIYYNRGKFECDFLVQEKNKITKAVQVCYELSEKNMDREISGLIEAMKKFKLKKGLIVTYDDEKEIVKDGLKIKVIPVWKWMLNK